jgi:hypothetical protein
MARGVFGNRWRAAGDGRLLLLLLLVRLLLLLDVDADVEGAHPGRRCRGRVAAMPNWGDKSRCAWMGGWQGRERVRRDARALRARRVRPIEAAGNAVRAMKA